MGSISPLQTQAASHPGPSELARKAVQDQFRMAWTAGRMGRSDLIAPSKQTQQTFMRRQFNIRLTVRRL